MLFSGFVAVVTLTLVSCSSTPETTTTTTRQTTVQTAAPPPGPASRTTTTTTHMGGGYWLPKAIAVVSVAGRVCGTSPRFKEQRW